MISLYLTICISYHITKKNLGSKFCFFADDLKLYLADCYMSSPLGNAHSVLQEDIDLLYARSSSWGLSFSVNKCARLHFHRQFATLPPPLRVIFLATSLFLMLRSSEIWVSRLTFLWSFIAMLAKWWEWPVGFVMIFWEVHVQVSSLHEICLCFSHSPDYWMVFSSLVYRLFWW